MRASKFSNIIIVVSVILLLFLVIYKFFISRPELTFTALFSYLFLVSLVIILLLCLKLSEAYKVNLVISLISISMTLYLVESLTTFTRQMGPVSFHIAAQKAGLPYDLRTKYEVIKQFESEGIDAWPTVNPFYFLTKGLVRIGDKEVLLLGGISNVTTVCCNESGTYLIYKSDEHGFHNPTGLYDVEDLSIAIVGDSFAVGYAIPSNKNIAAVIRNTHERTLNLGVAGMGPLAMLATIKEFAQPLKPRIVLWFYYEGNDLYELIGEKQSDLLMKYLTADFCQDLFSKQNEIDRQLKRFLTKRRLQVQGKRAKVESPPFLRFLTLGNLRTKIRSLFRSDRNKLSSHDELLFQEVLQTAKKTVSSWGGQFYFVYLSSWTRFKYPELANPHREKVLQLLDELEIPFIDIYRSFLTHDDPLSLFPFRLDGHYTEEGYKRVATAILEFLEDRSAI